MADPFAGVASPVTQSDPFAGVASPIAQEKPGRIEQELNYNKDIINKGSLPSVFDMIGSMGNVVGGTIKDTAKSAIEGVSNGISDVTPDALKQAYMSSPMGLVQRAGNKIFNTIASPVLDSVSNKSDQFAQNHPSTAHLASGVGNMITAGQIVDTGAKVAGKAPDLYSQGVDAFNKRKLAAVQDIVLPKQTPSEIANTALQRSSGGGLLNKQVYTPNANEADMIKTAADAGIKPSAPLETNIQILNSAKNAEAQRLKFTLDKANVPIDSATLNQAGVNLTQKIAANPLVDENSATVRKILETAQTAIDNNPKTAAGILQARKDFDNAITEFQPSALDTDAPATAFRYTAKQVRQGMNGVIADAVPDAQVRASLGKQSHMYDAIDNMAGKLHQQPDGRFPRFFDTKTGKAVKYGAGAVGAGAVARSVFHSAPTVTYSGEE